MKQKTNYWLWTALTCLIATLPMVAQNNLVNYQLNYSGIATKGDYAPFWLQNNRYGTLSEQAISSTLQTAIYKDFRPDKKIFDYSFKVNALAKTDKSRSEVYLHEYYAKARLYCTSIAIGAREEFYGTQDSTLSSGNILYSQNARPIPQIFAGIEQFTVIPFTFHLLEVKGGISNGWFTDNISTSNNMLHHKFFYLRGGGKLPVTLQYGIEHVAQWGGNSANYGPQPSGLKDFITIFKGQSGGSEIEAINALGNHILSQTLRADLMLAKWHIYTYWQSLNEDGPIKFMGYTMNAADGLWGFAIRNSSLGFIKGVVYEYLNTSDQSGPYHDKDGIVYGGADSYFRNSVYTNGWNHYLRTIGTALISSPVYNTDHRIDTKNNRVVAHHFGLEGDIASFSYRTLATFSRNLGTYTSPLSPTLNTSVMLEVRKRIPQCNQLEIGCSMGLDIGKLYGNNTGLMISLKKKGDLFHY